MPNTIPVARLEKLWRRYCQLRGMAFAEMGRATAANDYATSVKEWAAGCIYIRCAADLRKLIDEAKGADDAKA